MDKNNQLFEELNATTLHGAANNHGLVQNGQTWKK